MKNGTKIENVILIQDVGIKNWKSNFWSKMFKLKECNPEVVLKHL